MNKPRAIIVDIDGTLADCSHRRHHLEKKPKDWASFNKLMSQDPVNRWCQQIVMAMSDQYEIIVVSGREDVFRSRTHEWLVKNLVEPSALFMRPEKDYRDDQIIKREIYERDIAPRWDILFVLDDRKRVVDMWRSLGLVCLQCAPGEF